MDHHTSESTTDPDTLRKSAHKRIPSEDQVFRRERQLTQRQLQMPESIKETIPVKPDVAEEGRSALVVFYAKVFVGSILNSLGYVWFVLTILVQSIVTRQRIDPNELR